MPTQDLSISKQETPAVSNQNSTAGLVSTSLASINTTDQHYQSSHDASATDSDNTLSSETHPKKSQRQQFTLRDQLDGFPFWQMFVIMTVRFSEPVSMTSLFPYVYFMVKHLRPQGSEASVSRYAGYISGSFALCQALTGVHWGRYSDKYGRKPILLIGMLGTCVSLFWFGTAQSYHLAMIARCLGGVLNGNVGVIRTSIGEIAPKRQHQALAMSTMSLLWQLGCVIGPMIGGSLADPIINHPGWFSEGSRWKKLFEKCPFLLPNIVTSALLFNSLILAFLFLEESHPDYLGRNQYDFGLAIGDTIIQFLTFGKFNPAIARNERYQKQLRDEEEAASIISEESADSKKSSTDGTQSTESTNLLQRVDDVVEEDMEYISGEFTNHDHLHHHHSVTTENTVPNYGSLNQAQRQHTPSNEVTTSSSSKKDNSANGTFFQALTPAVLSTMSMYFLIALQTVVFDEMLPLMASTPPVLDPAQGGPSRLPFHFVGGLGLTSVQVGNLLSMTGLMGTFLVMFYFPYVDGKYGTYGPFCLVNKIFPLVHVFMPFSLLLVGAPPESAVAKGIAWVQKKAVDHGFTPPMYALLAIMMFKTLLMAIAFPAVMLLINRAIPNRKHTGGINGLSQMFAATARAIGPIIWGLIMAKGQEWQIAELPWWLLAVVCLGSFGFIKILDRYRDIFEKDE